MVDAIRLRPGELPAQPPESDDSLGELLNQGGARPAPVADPERPHSERSGVEDPPVRDVGSQEQAVPPADVWAIVKLPEGETLIHVARRHLGDGRRFAEVMNWNGWSESDARRLPTGQEIRLKRAEMR